MGNGGKLCVSHERDHWLLPTFLSPGPLDSTTQPPGHAPSCDLPQQAEARCGGWGDGSGERLLFCKPHPLLGVLL